jgi:hypothetical protein
VSISVVSPLFDEKTSVQRQRMVYKVRFAKPEDNFTQLLVVVHLPSARQMCMWVNITLATHPLARCCCCMNPDIATHLHAYAALEICFEL